MADGEVPATGGSLKKLTDLIFQSVMGSGPMPWEVILGMVSEAFPAYTLEALQSMEDWSDLLRVMTARGEYKQFAHDKESGFSKPNERTIEMLVKDKEAKWGKTGNG